MAKARSLTQPEYEELAEFRYLLRRFLVFSENAAHEVGLTSQQHQALLAIKGFRDGNITTGTLAERLGLKHHSTVGLIDRLAGNGLIKRANGEVDRRQVLIHLTPKAEKLLSTLSLAHRKELGSLAPLLRDLLSQLVAHNK